MKAATASLFLLFAAAGGSSAFDVQSKATTTGRGAAVSDKRPTDSRLNYVDSASLEDDVSSVLPLASFLAKEHQDCDTSSFSSSSSSSLSNDSGACFSLTAASLTELKPWDLPTHHPNDQVLQRKNPSSGAFLDLEMIVGRVSICLAVILFGSELLTGQSLPILIVSALVHN